MVVNMNMHTDKEGNINQYLSDTIAGVFGNVCTAEVPGTTNRELFAAVDASVLENLSGKAEKLENPELKAMMQTVSAGLTSYEKGDYLLTDDKAAVELLGMQVIDELINSEMGYYKEVFRSEGIAGLLKSM